jgi:hypothetical protein
MLLMYVYLYVYVTLHFICILSSQNVVYFLTMHVNFQFGSRIVTVYRVGERWHVLPCGTKKFCCRNYINCSFRSCRSVQSLIFSCSSCFPQEHVSNPKSDVLPGYVYLIIEQHYI